MNKYNFTILTVSFWLAMILTFSCSSDNGDENNSSTSSSSGSSSSDNVEKVKIGEQTWMKKNLNVVPSTDSNNAATNSWCYGDDPAFCEKYGRLYDWATAMALPEKCNSTLTTDDPDCTISYFDHKGICPKGYHIPDNYDWRALFSYVDGNTGTSSPYSSATAGKYLKSIEGWVDCDSTGASYACLDTYGFSALPGSGRNNNGSFSHAGNNGYWWSAAEHLSNYAYGMSMYHSNESAGWGYSDKTFGFSVRCVKD